VDSLYKSPLQISSRGEVLWFSLALYLWSLFRKQGWKYVTRQIHRYIVRSGHTSWPKHTIAGGWTCDPLLVMIMHAPLSLWYDVVNLWCLVMSSFMLCTSLVPLIILVVCGVLGVTSKSIQFMENMPRSGQEYRGFETLEEAREENQWFLAYQTMDDQPIALLPMPIGESAPRSRKVGWKSSSSLAAL
jgi:hypothetical protein